MSFILGVCGLLRCPAQASGTTAPERVVYLDADRQSLGNAFAPSDIA